MLPRNGLVEEIRGARENDVRTRRLLLVIPPGVAVSVDQRQPIDGESISKFYTTVVHPEIY